MNNRSRILSIGLALFALNAAICGPLFAIEFLDDFQSNEGSWITFAAFLRQNWPHVGWFPFYDAGMPFENTYLPGVSALVALVSAVVHGSTAHVFHFVAALAYSLAPVSLFLFALTISGRVWASAWAGLLWSLFSPSLIFPHLLRDTGSPWGIRRLRDMVFFGETPHNVAICLLPVSLLLIWRFWDQPTARRFALAAIASAAVMLTNAFGIVVVLISSLILLAARRTLSLKEFASLCGILLAAYLAMCRFLPPSLIGILEKNAQVTDGDFRFTLRSVELAGVFLAVLVALWILTRLLFNPALQFAVLFSACFGGIAVLGLNGINLLPQPLRYHLELEPGICLLAAFIIEPIMRRFSWKLGVACAFVPLAWLAVKDWRFARELIHPADLAHSLPYREARWIAANLPDERVLVSTVGQYSFNLFAANPQLSAGHEPSAPNWVQKLAVYTIYSGQNAGAQDGPISVLWLKAFGCGAIVVAGKDSKDYFHAVVNPDKFEGLVPRVWRDSGDSIYRIPQRSASLAHVIPMSAVVRSQPINGLDVGELRRYVDALDAEATLPVNIVWEDPDHARIAAKMEPSQVLSVQITYDPGWEARVGNRKVKISADKLGFIVMEPECSECSIDLEFKGGRERHVTAVASLLSFLGLIAMLFYRTHR